MAKVEFKTIKGKSGDIIQKLSQVGDLIVEGGMGTNGTLMGWFREEGYSGPYVGMDLFNGKEPDGDWYKETKSRDHENFWHYKGNCFLAEDVKPIIQKFSPENPTFVTWNALSNALFGRKLNLWNKKRKSDRIPVEAAVIKLNDTFNTQLHKSPADVYTLASEEYYEDGIEDDPKIESPFGGLNVFDFKGFKGAKLGTFRDFVYKSAELGWLFLVPKDSIDMVVMTKGKNESYQKLTN